MGIRGLQQILNEYAPNSIHEWSFEHYMGKIVAFDASIVLYQFMSSILMPDGTPLRNSAGEITSHLKGLFNRIIRFLEKGIKPVFVFDGKPPEFKSGEIAKRRAAKEKAAEAYDAAKEAGDTETMYKFARRNVNVEPKHGEQAKRLLEAMGVPWVQAPCEADSQCAALCREGLVDIVATNDMDILAHGSPRMVRYMTDSAANKRDRNGRIVPPKRPTEIVFRDVLEELGLSKEAFIDFCILSKCDYCETLPHIGPKTALQLIKKYGSIEAILSSSEKKVIASIASLNADDAENLKHDLIASRKMFTEPEITPIDKLPALQWQQPSTDAVLDFLVDKMGFNHTQVSGAMEALLKNMKKPKQMRLDSFMKITTKRTPTTPSKSSKGTAKEKTTKSAPQTPKAGSKSVPQTPKSHTQTPIAIDKQENCDFVPGAMSPEFEFDIDFDQDLDLGSDYDDLPGLPELAKAPLEKACEKEAVEKVNKDSNENLLDKCDKEPASIPINRKIERKKREAPKKVVTYTAANEEEGDDEDDDFV